MQRTQHIIGITGGIGSGKTVVSTIFRKLGVPVFFSDIEAANLISYNKKIIAKIRKKFGNEVFYNSIIDRKKLAQLVFADTKKLADLNSIVHPAVRKKFNEWKKKQKKTLFIVYEASILIETGGYNNVDIIILVTAPLKLRIERVMKRNNVSKKEVLARVKNQWSDTVKKKFADAIIVNNDKKPVLPQALKIYENINRKSNS